MIVHAGASCRVMKSIKHVCRYSNFSYNSHIHVLTGSRYKKLINLELEFPI